ncbi:MAG: NAD(P)-dependent oxidoreductase [Candidatus Vogelbacteria bacterium]|nr:NAD(P)-dependent oxidoreductase [Candidatus Vogelbacteria bacterium]
MKQKVLITGNLGYIGTVLVDELRARGYEPVGYDMGYYRGMELAEARDPRAQIMKDTRDAVARDFAGIDAVIHLAALSNDPLGELTPNITEDINFTGTMTVARAARAAGVKRFIYASSQSMYGVADTSHELTEDEAGPYGVTAYARTKWDAEVELKKMNRDDFIVACFRPSTVFGASPRLRCDIVYNSLVGSAYLGGKVEVKSDGTPWRPVVHVRDVSRAFIAGLEAPRELVAGESFNVGISNGNFTVRDLAEATQRAVPGSTLVFTGEHGKDSRTYRVSFQKILTKLKDYYKPTEDLDSGGSELVDFFKKVHISEDQFRGPACNRLKQIQRLLVEGRLDDGLRWVEQDAST